MMAVVSRGAIVSRGEARWSDRAGGPGLRFAHHVLSVAAT